MRPKNIVVIALIAGTLSACAVTEPPRRHETRVVLVAPPAPRVVVVPEARAGYVWAPGYWRWNGHEHVWIEGRWLPERRGYHWVPERWEQRRDGWHFEEGHWER